MNSRGIQLSIQFVVVLILGLVIFGSGIALFYQVFGSAQEYESDISSQMKERLNSLMDDGQMFVVMDASKSADPGKSVDFVLGINNKLPATTFTVAAEVVPSGWSAPRFASTSYELPANGKEYFVAIIDVPPGTNSGEYSYILSLNCDDLPECNSEYARKQLIVRVR